MLFAGGSTDACGGSCPDGLVAISSTPLSDLRFLGLGFRTLASWTARSSTSSFSLQIACKFNHKPVSNTVHEMKDGSSLVNVYLKPPGGALQ